MSSSDSNQDLPFSSTSIPNILVQMRLSPHELATYFILKYIAGESSQCCKSTAELCDKIGIGKMKYIQVKESLEARGLIRITKRKHVHGGNLSDLITIIDVYGGQE